MSVCQEERWMRINSTVLPLTLFSAREGDLFYCIRSYSPSNDLDFQVLTRKHGVIVNVLYQLKIEGVDI